MLCVFKIVYYACDVLWMFLCTWLGKKVCGAKVSRIESNNVKRGCGYVFPNCEGLKDYRKNRPHNERVLAC